MRSTRFMCQEWSARECGQIVEVICQERAFIMDIPRVEVSVGVCAGESIGIPVSDGKVFGVDNVFRCVFVSTGVVDVDRFRIGTAHHVWW